MESDRIKILLASCASENIHEQEWENRVTELKDLNILTDKEYVVLWKYYTTGATYEEIGQELNVTRERIRQVLMKAEYKVRKSQRARTLLSKGVKAYDTENYIKTLEQTINELNQEIYNKKCEVNRLITRYEILSDRVKEEGVEQDLSQVRLEELNLSHRAYRSVTWHLYLKGRKEPTLENLLNLTLFELSTIRNAGSKTQKEIIDKVHNLGYKFKGEE